MAAGAWMCVSSWWTEEHTQLQRVQTGTTFMSSHLQTEDVSSTHLQGAPVSVSVEFVASVFNLHATDVLTSF